MKVKLWGTRGSIPSPGPETIRYGGNTSCVGVTLSDGSLLALDAGTGIRSLGLALAAEPARLHILLTHLHLDHIQGLVFFAPAFRPQTEIVIWGPASPEASLRDRIARYISAPLSPVEVRELPCDVSFRHCPQAEWEIGPARIRAASVAHRGPTLGYRIDDGDSSLAYIPDHEPALGADLDALEEDWISGFGLARDASLLIHDGQYADAEYPDHIGWGHSSLSHAALLRPPHRRRAHRALPPRPDALRRPARPARRRGAGALGGRWGATQRRSSWRSSEPSTSCPRGQPLLQAEHQNSSAIRDARYAATRMPSTPGIEAAVESSELVKDALETARRAHAGQIRSGSGGRPYIEHPLAVAELLAEHGYDDEVLAAALLHDVVEKSDVEVGRGARALRRSRWRTWSRR